MFPEESNRDCPPVCHHYRRQNLHCGLGPVIPKDTKAVWLQWMKSNLFSVVMIERVVDADRLESVKQSEQQGQGEKRSDEWLVEIHQDSRNLPTNLQELSGS